MKRFGVVALLCLTTFAVADPAPPETLAGDDLGQGLWWLYHLRYEKAIGLYDQHIAAHPEDPAGYFYKAAADWWHLAQELEYDHPDLQTRFYGSVDLAVEKAKEQLEKLDEKTQAHQAALAYLYWGGAEGLRGRWLVAQKHWAKAYFSGREGDSRLKDALALDPTLYDADMGLGIYDYFSDTLSGFMGFLANVFVRGDRKRGISELELAIEKGDHARIESQIFLSEIYLFEENTPEKALPMVEGLYKKFPDSPLMHLLLITALYQTKQWDRMETEARDYLAKSEKETPWYTKSGVAPALYCLGMSDLWNHQRPDDAFVKMTQIIENAPADDPNRWISFAHLRRGQIDDLRHDRAKAEAEYRLVLNRKDIWGSHHEAEKYLKKPFAMP